MEAKRPASSAALLSASLASAPGGAERAAPRLCRRRLGGERGPGVDGPRCRGVPGRDAGEGGREADRVCAPPCCHWAVGRGTCSVWADTGMLRSQDFPAGKCVCAEGLGGLRPFCSRVRCVHSLTGPPSPHLLSGNLPSCF